MFISVNTERNRASPHIRLIVMNSILYGIGTVVVSLGFMMTIFSDETKKRHYIGWILMGISISIFGVYNFIHGNIGSAIFDVGIGLVDYFLAYFWHGKYIEAKKEKELKKLNNRERFLREIIDKKW